MARVGVRVLEALPLAWAHVRRVLFRPFRAGRWLTLGFLSFLQGLGEGGYNYNFNIPDFTDRRGADREALQEVLRWVAERLPLVLTACGVLLVLGIALVLLLMWLSARGTFAYLDCIATNRAEVRRPWREHRTLANSYFGLRVVVGLVTLAVLVGLTVQVGVLVVKRLQAREGLRARVQDAGWEIAGDGNPRAYSMAVLGPDGEDEALWDSSLIVILILWGVLAGLVVLANVVLNVLLVDFVAPVQYLMKVGAFEALKTVGGLVTSHVGVFLLYLIVRLALFLAVGCGTFAVGCLTCCVFFCIAAIPVLSQTVLQPVYALFRAFPLFVLRQFGPEWDAIVLPSPGPTT